jgi:hypothetical protein
LAAAAVLAVALIGVMNLRAPRETTDGFGGPSAFGAGFRPPSELAILNALEAECRPAGGDWFGHASLYADPRVAPTLGLLTHNLRVLDLAIAELKEAWSQDPQNSRLVRRLAEIYRVKAGLENGTNELVSRI